MGRGLLERGGQRQQPAPTQQAPPPPPPPVQPMVSSEIILALKRKGYSVNQSLNKFIVRKGSGDNRKVFGGRQDTAQEGWMVALKDSLQ